MSLRKSALVVSMAAGMFVLAPALWAQEQPAVEVPNARNIVVGEINAPGVYVRSGPAESYYPAAQLNKGDRVTVVGHTQEWLKIAPPAGSFSYVAKSYIDREGASGTGKINSNDVLVRAGALSPTVQPQAAQPQIKLDRGASVEIIGEADAYYKVKPPQGVYFFVAKRFVDQVQQTATAPAAGVGAGTISITPGVVGTGAAAPQGTSTELMPTPTTKPHKKAPAKVEKATKTETATEVAPLAAEGAPDADLESDFRKLEVRFEQAKEQPLEDQPITEMLKGYTELQDNARLSSTSRRMAAFRVKYLTAAEKQQAELLKAKQEASDFAARQMESEKQTKQMEERIKQNGVAVYVAVGQLRTSSVQKDGQPLLRLVDPADGRTLIYVRTADTKQRAMVGKFVGIRGETTKDDQLSIDYIEPMELEQVDPARVFKGVTAKIYPPSALRTPTTNP